MIISDEQVRLAAVVLRDSADHDSKGERGVHADVSPEFLDRVRALLAEEPETRPDRVRHARESLGAESLTADMLAGKFIGRIICDSLR